MTVTYQRFTAVLLIYGSLFLSGIYYCLRVFWCAAARMSELQLEQRTNIKFLVKLGKSGNEIREMLVQVSGDNAMKKTPVHKWVKHPFWWKRKCHWRREIRTANNKQNWRKHCRSSSNCVWKSSADCQEHSRACEHRQGNGKILTEDLDVRKVCAKMVPKELTEVQKQRRVFSY